MTAQRIRALCPALAVASALFAHGVAAAPLHDAAAAGDVAKVRALITEGADVNAAEKNGLTPLLAAIFSEHEDVVAALIEAGAAVNRATELDGDVLREHGADIQAGQRPHVTPLLVASFLGDRAAVEHLLRAKGDVRGAGDDGMQPLHIAGFRAGPEIATMLLDSGSDVNARDGNADTPLHKAAAAGNVPFAEVLLGRGADLNIRNGNAVTPLHAAAARGTAAMTKLLLARGAWVNAIDDEGRTPLDNANARAADEIAALLVRGGGVAMREKLGAKVDTSGTNPRLTLLVDRALLEEIAPLGPRPLGIALDAARGKLFWTEYANDAIHRSDLDGGHAERLDVDDLSGPIGIALDPAEEQIFWTSDATYPRKVQRADSDGSNVEEIASGEAVNRPLAIAVDDASKKVFWTESIAGRIRVANLDGSEIEDIATSGISSEGDRADAREFKALGIAVDGGKVYWTEMLGDEIVRADLDGANAKTIISASAGLELPAGIVVAGGHLYWAEAGAAKIRRANLDGSAIADVLTVADGLVEPYALAADRSAGRLYWSDASTGAIASATFAGKDVRTIVTPRAAATLAAGDAAADCTAAAAAAGTRYVLRTVNAIGTCLGKVDALKAVWRRQSDGARAAVPCRAQFDRLAGTADRTTTIEGELRGALVRACGDGVLERLRDGSGPVRALVEKRCAAVADARPGVECVIDGFRDAAYSAVALRFRRAREWLEEARPFMAAAGGSAATKNALANLDRLYAALQTMAVPAPATAQPAAAATPLVTTGQTASYAALGVERATDWTAVPDDGAVRSGALPRYADNGDGTITDAITGLMWEKKCDGCGGLHDFQASYSFEPAEGGVASWLADLNRENGRGYAGHRDWRLPTIKELQSLVDYERFNPAVPRAFDGDACGLGCTDITRPECSCTGMMWHCSGTTFKSVPEGVFALGFNLGIIGDLHKTDACAVRAVRTAAAQPAADEKR